MSAFRCKRRVRLWLAAVMLLGCHAKTGTEADQSPHLASLVQLYLQAQSKLGRPPADEAEFKSFISSNVQLDSLHVGKIDELFVSERDGQTFAVLYGPPRSGIQSGLVAYEQTGVAGKRLIASSLGAVTEVGPKKFAKLVSHATVRQ